MIPPRSSCNRKARFPEIMALAVNEDVLIECEPTYATQVKIGMFLNRLKYRRPRKRPPYPTGVVYTQRVERGPVPGIRVWRLA